MHGHCGKEQSTSIMRWQNAANRVRDTRAEAHSSLHSSSLFVMYTAHVRS